MHCVRDADPVFLSDRPMSAIFIHIVMLQQNGKDRVIYNNRKICSLMELENSEIRGPESDKVILVATSHGGRAKRGQKEKKRGPNTFIYNELTTSKCISVHWWGLRPPCLLLGSTCQPCCTGVLFPYGNLPRVFSILEVTLESRRLPEHGSVSVQSQLGHSYVV